MAGDKDGQHDQNEVLLRKADENLLSAIENAVHRANDRSWNRKQDAFTFEEALENVTDVLKAQLLDPKTLNAPEALILRGSLALQEVFDPLPPSEETIEAAIEYSLEDPAVFDALRTLAVLGYTAASPALKRFQTQFLAGMIAVPKSKRGPSAFRDIHRNMVIIGQIEQLKAIGIDPTRNSATSDQRSGCDVIVLSLEKIGLAKSYSAVEKIWKNRKEVARPIFLAEILKQVFMSDLSGHLSD